MPKKGFLNFTRREYAPLNIAKLQSWIAQGRIDTGVPITIGTVIRSNLVHGIKGWSGVKLLGKPDPNMPLPPIELELSRFSKTAAKAVIDAGGNVTAVYHTPLGLRQEIWPEKFAGREIRNAAPIRRTDIGESPASAAVRNQLTGLQSTTPTPRTTDTSPSTPSSTPTTTRCSRLPSRPRRARRLARARPSPSRFSYHIACTFHG